MCSSIDRMQVENSINLFLKWVNKNGYASYDPYNLWSTWYGITSKRVYLQSKIVGGVLVAPLVAADILFPKVARIGMQKHRFPISDAHFILGYCNLYEVTGNEQFLREAEEVGKELLKQSLGANYHGHCWGYPFDWQTNQGLWKRSTPIITTTPYCFEAYLKLYDCTGKVEYEQIASSIATFALEDLNEKYITPSTSSTSYSPIDNTMVVNANAYRAFVLTEAWKRFGSDRYINAAKRNLNFIVDTQEEDGSWLYSHSNRNDAFVDNFHTCLVLKNLMKTNRVLGNNSLWDAIEKGYRYYSTHLLGNDGQPIPFAKLQRINIVSKEMYDYAEGISLATLISENFPERSSSEQVKNSAAKNCNVMVNSLLNLYQEPDGYFTTKIHFNIFKNKVPYIRWAQAQIFYALTNVVVAIANRTKQSTQNSTLLAGENLA